MGRTKWGVNAGPRSGERRYVAAFAKRWPSARGTCQFQEVVVRVVVMDVFATLWQARLRCWPACHQSTF